MVFSNTPGYIRYIAMLTMVIFAFTGGISYAADVDYYTCGMHPSVKVSPKEYKKGNVNCPICNMKLVPVYKEEAGAKEIYYGCGIETEGHCPHCDMGRPDSKCICGQHSFAIKGKKINCPVCGEPLRELTKDEADKLKGVAGRVNIKGDQLKLAGVRTEPVRRIRLYKEIRTVGKVAYDPHLAIAEEEFISALKAMDKIEGSDISEIRERGEGLLESSRRKLKLLGLSQAQIGELEKTRQVHTSLVLPGKKMWIYGDIYEYELNWVKIGSKVKVTTSSIPGKEYYGVVSSLNPVINPKTRSLIFRAEVDNPDLALRPEMYVDVAIKSVYIGPDKKSAVLAVPKDAVLDTGTRKVVWVKKSAQAFEGREVILGPEATAKIEGRENRFYPVLRGLDEGELVVTKANFLIDSQSQISGTASAAYGGALGAEEGTMNMGH